MIDIFGLINVRPTRLFDLDGSKTIIKKHLQSCNSGAINKIFYSLFLNKIRILINQKDHSRKIYAI